MRNIAMKREENPQMKDRNWETDGRRRKERVDERK